jgi:hypothetical protein
MWEAGSWGRGQFEKPEDGKRPSLEAAAKQQAIKVWEDFMCTGYTDLLSM